MSVETQLRERLRANFDPLWLEVENESHQHSVPPNSETHFRVVMASEQFSGKRPVARHQLVYSELAELIAGPIHALALHLYDNAEWTSREAPAPASPDCMGGSKGETGSSA